MVVWLGISIVLAAIVLAAPWRWAIGVFLFFTPFNATAVAMVGVDPILIPFVLSVSLCLRYALSLGDRDMREEALLIFGKEGWLLGFVGYCVVSGLLFPRLFEGQAQVFRLESDAFWVLMPLSPKNISLAQIVYLLLGALPFLILRHVIDRVGPASAILALVLQAIFIGGMGFLQAVFGLGGIVVPVEWIVNNLGATLLVGVSEGSFSRVTGIFTEASSFGAWGVGALGLLVMLFLNRILPLTTLALAAMLAFTLLLSTSSTAYGGLAVLALAFAVTVGLDGDPKRRERGLVILALGGAIAVAVVLLIFTADYGPLYALRLLLEGAIFGKQYSLSALERGAWANSAFQAGIDTFLLGAGYGAVRSSGVLALLFGAVGVPGLILITMFLAPKVALAMKRVNGPDAAVASACGFAVIPAIGVLAISASDLAVWNMFWYYAAVAAAAGARAARTAPIPSPAPAAEPSSTNAPSVNSARGAGT